MKGLCFYKNICLLLLLGAVPVFSQKYEISITLKSRNDTIILGHYFTKRERPRANDTIILKNGKGVFRGNRDLEKGIYFLYNDKRILFDFIIGDNKKFGVVIDTADFINLTKFTSSPDNDVFFEYWRHNVNRVKQLQQLSELYKNATSDAEKSDITAKLNTVNRESLTYIDKLIEDNRHLYVSKVLKSLIPLMARIPEPPKDDEGNVIDPNYQYRWYRAHFFDNLDIFDPDMLRTQSYEEKLLEYITSVIPQHTDSLCVEIDKILAKAQANETVFPYLLGTIFTHFYDSKDIVRGYVVPENVWVYIAEKWFIPFATWAFGGKFHEYLVEQVPKRKPNLIGKHAPPIEMMVLLPPEHFKAAALDTAIKYDPYAGRMVDDFRKDRELKSKYTVLFFWDYSCSHCKQAIQELFNIWEEHKGNGLQVITVQIYYSKREDKGRWIDFVNEKNLFGAGWFNAWSPYNYKYRELYNTANVPVMYLLDEKFDIIFRNIVPEQLKDIFDNQIVKNQQ